MAFNPTLFFEYGKKRGGAPNTFIGGVASVINTPALLAAKLQNYPSRSPFSAANITNFTIVGSDIECYIGVDYQIAGNAFFNNTLITYYEDYFSCKSVLLNVFRNSSIKIVCLKECLELYQGINDSFQFYDAYNLEVCCLPKCITYGAWIDATKPYIFQGSTKTGFRLYAEPTMQTINAGAEEGDIAWARANKSARIAYVTDFTAPNPITDLSVATVYGTALQLNFTAPTGNTNAIEFYEVWVNGVYVKKIVSGGFVTGLSLNTSYTIEVKPTDIYYNKSTSNIVTQTTSATYVIPTANIVSYYKMEGNVLDSVGTNNGTATAITYEAGLVGQTAVFNGTTSFINLNSTSIIGGKSAFSLVIPFKMTTKTENSLYGSWGTPEKIIVRVLSGQIQFYTHTGTQVGGSFIAFTDTTAFHIITCTYDGAKMRVYLDNVLSGTTYNQTGTINLGGDTEKIGNDRGNTGSGLFDEVSIFNKALTAAEVSDINAKYESGQSLI